MQKNNCLNYALKLLARKWYSKKRISDKLAQKDFEDEEIKKTVQFLEDKYFIDDNKFAESLVKSKIAYKPQGKYKLKIWLKKHQFSDESIDKALSLINTDAEVELVKSAKEKWLKQKSADQNDPKVRIKLIRYLISQGFNYEIIKQAMSE